MKMIDERMIATEDVTAEQAQIYNKQKKLDFDVEIENWKSNLNYNRS